MYRIGIVAHTARRQRARVLESTVGADHLHLDDGTLGCTRSHRKVWDTLWRNRGEAEWLVVLEDDAEPVGGFGEQLAAALAVAPSPVVSLYLGRKRPARYQPRIAYAVSNTDAHWITMPVLIHAVAVAMRVDAARLWRLNGDLAVARLHLAPDETPIDEAISHWLKAEGLVAAYSHPSLVDHADEDTLADHPDGQPRKPGRVAWKVGIRDDWNSSITRLR